MKTRKPLFFILLVLVLVLSACGSDIATTSEAPAPADSPSDAASSEDSADSSTNSSGESTDPGPDSLDLTDMSTFAEIPIDYNMKLLFNFHATDDNGDPIDSTLSIEGAFQQDPFASSVDMLVTGAGDLGGVDSVSYAEMDDTLYFYNEINGCVTLPGQQDTLYDDFVDTGGLLTGVLQRIQRDEEINGVPSYAFAITEENLDASDPASADIQQLNSGTLYMAKDGGYVTRLVLDGVGVSEVLTQSDTLLGDIHYQLDFIPAPNGVTASIPEGCDSQTGEVDFPVLDDATNRIDYSGFYSYETRYDVESAMDFYKTELAAEGWTLTNEIQAAGTAVMQFANDGSTLSVTVSPIPNNEGAFTVVVAQQ